MVWPLIWLGGAAIGVLALADEKARRDRLALDRRLGRVEPQAATAAEGAALTPSILFNSNTRVTPEVGSIVCCHVYGVIEHTGIWLGDNSIAELHGSGLVRAVSAKRFLAGRSGDCIYLACSHDHRALACQQAAVRASESMFTYRDYQLLDNNCHRFVWYCLTGDESRISSFDGLSIKLAALFSQAIYWDLMKSSE
ncbi:hypothetical protein [Shewanella sp. GXUN23E]|uniref:hypothetical protein n=1 Tax=Shewanella sp. GXUN23E TaxID=3422498 RepID=UPI003D7C6FA6